MLVWLMNFTEEKEPTHTGVSVMFLWHRVLFLWHGVVCIQQPADRVLESRQGVSSAFVFLLLSTMYGAEQSLSKCLFNVAEYLWTL